MAVAFDAASNSGKKTTSPATWSHTVGSGSNLFLVVGVSLYSTSSQITGNNVTYAGLAMNKIRFDQVTNGAQFIESSLWFLFAPATGANNVVVSFSGGINQACIIGASSYTGAQQFNVSDGSNGYTNPNETDGGANPNVHLLVNLETNNGWGVMTGIAFNNANADETFIQNFWTDPHLASVAANNRWDQTVADTTSVSLGADSGSFSITGTSRNASVGWAVSNPSLIAVSAASFAPSGTLPNLAPGASGISDNITTSESVGIAQAQTIHASDAVATADIIPTKFDVLYQIVKADTAQTGEGVTTGTQTAIINVSESEPLTEFLKLIAEDNVKLSDNPVTSEFQKLLVDENIASSDTVTTSESIQAIITPLLVNASDSATTQEHLGLILSIADYQVFQGDLVSTSEFVQLLIPQLLSPVSDSTTTSESTTVFVTELFAQVSDTTTISEFIQFFISLPITVGDGASTNEFLDVMRANTRDPLVSDTSQLSESVATRTSDYFRAVQDVVTATDISTVSGPITAPRLVIHKEIIEFTANTHIFLTLVMD